MTREELNQKVQNDIERDKTRKEITDKTKVIGLKVFKILSILFVSILVFYLYVTYISTSSFIVKEKRLSYDNLPASFDGVKIIQFSDLHYGSTVKNKKLDEIIKMINERNPDIVIFTGDLIADGYELSNKKQENFTNKLMGIKANLGKYAVVGNEDGDNYQTIMNQAGFTILNNSYERLYNDSNDSIILSGFSSSLKDGFNPNIISDEDKGNINTFSIAMYHEPDSTSDVLGNYKYNLLLAGHSHNGYYRVPFIGTLWNKKGYMKYSQAYYDVDGSDLYISSGLGTEAEGIRVFSRPSINFFRLTYK